MRKIILFIPIIVSNLYLSSCKCGGANEIISTTGIDIKAPETYSVGLSSLTLDVRAVTETKKGDRKCLYKNEILAYENPIQTNTLRIYTDSELKLKTITIPANTNILQYKNLDRGCSDTISTNFFVCQFSFGNQVDSNTRKGKYRFYVEGTTNSNITYKDSADVEIK